MSGMVMMLPTVVMNVILGDERRIAAVFQTEHRAETRYGHRNDNRIDVVDLIAYTTYLEQEINAQRYYHKTQERGEVYLRTADNLLHRNLAIEEPIIIRAAGTAYVADHRYRTRNDIGRMNPESYQEGGNKGTKKSRRKQHLRIELLDAVLALDEHDTCRKNKKVFGMLRVGIKNWLRTEYA